MDRVGNVVHQIHLGHVMLPDSHPRAADRTCEIYSYAIDHPDGVIVVDTGPRSGHPVIDQMYAPDVVTIVAGLNAAGLDERDVTAVVNSHLHFDHCGQNHLLAPAPVWVTEAELQASKAEFYTVSAWAEIEPNRLRLATDGESLTDGVMLLHTPGHTPGHLSLAVDTVSGLELIVGQACYRCSEFEARTTAIEDMHDASLIEAGLDSLARLHALQPSRAHFSHDAATFLAGSTSR